MKLVTLLALTIGSLSTTALADPQPDFSLPDANNGSPRGSQLVSPRDYLQQVTVWYFSREW